MRPVYLESVFACVACAAYYYVAKLLEGVERELAAWHRQHLLDHALSLRALHGELCVIVRLVLQVDVVAIGILLHPCPVFVDVGCVDYEEVFIVGHLVYEQVVYGAPVFVEHHSV